MRKSGLFAFVQLAVFFAFLSLLTGCSKMGGDVKGTVTLDGKRLTMGTVTLHNDDGSKATAVIASDGSYVVVRPNKGNCAVTVEVLAPVAINTAPGAAVLDVGGKDKKEKTEPPTIPGKYKDPKTSGLSVKVTGTPTELDISLQGEKKSEAEKK
jgi:hypothetical protein